MALFGLLGKKRKGEFELHGAGAGAPHVLESVGVPHEGPPIGAFPESPAGFPPERPSFGREAPPSFSMPSPPAVQQQQSFDQQQLVLAKLDAIRATLDSVVQRLERIERLAQPEEEKPRWR